MMSLIILGNDDDTPQGVSQILNAHAFSEYLKQKGIDAAIVDFLSKKEVDGTTFLKENFISSTFTDEILINEYMTAKKNENPNGSFFINHHHQQEQKSSTNLLDIQGLIDLRNEILVNINPNSFEPHNTKIDAAIADTDNSNIDHAMTWKRLEGEVKNMSAKSAQYSGFLNMASHVAKMVNDFLPAPKNNQSNQSNNNNNSATTATATATAASGFTPLMILGIIQGAMPHIRTGIDMAKNLSGNSKKKCFQLLEKIQESSAFLAEPPSTTTTTASSSSFENNNGNENASPSSSIVVHRAKAYHKLHDAVDDAEALISRFVVPEKSGGLISESYQWYDYLTAGDGEFDTIMTKLDEAIDEMKKLKESDQQQNHHHQNSSSAVVATTTTTTTSPVLMIQDRMDDINSFVRNLRESVSSHYISHFKYSFHTAAPDGKEKENKLHIINSELMYVEVKLKRKFPIININRENENNGNNNRNDDNDENDGVVARHNNNNNNNYNNHNNKFALIEGGPGTSKTSFLRHFCSITTTNVDDNHRPIAVFIPLKNIPKRLRIDSIATLLEVVEAPKCLIEALPQILHHQIPLSFLLDGYEDVMRTDDKGIQYFLHNFLDPVTRNKNINENSLPNLVRACDFITLTSRGKNSRIDTSGVVILDADDETVLPASLKPTVWTIEPWGRAEIEKYIKKFFGHFCKALLLLDQEIQELVDDFALHPQVSALHGNPLFVARICEIKFDAINRARDIILNSNRNNTKLSPACMFQRILRNFFDSSLTSINNIIRRRPALWNFRGNREMLFESSVTEAAKNAFYSLLRRRSQNHQNHHQQQLKFSVPRDEPLPLWIIVMRELGVVLRDDEKSNSPVNFVFKDFSVLNFLIAHHVVVTSSSVDRALRLVPFNNELADVWLLMSQLARTKENSDGLLKVVVDKLTSIAAVSSPTIENKKLVVTFDIFMNHVVQTAKSLFDEINSEPSMEQQQRTESGSDTSLLLQLARQTEKENNIRRQQVECSEFCQVELLVQIVNSSSDNKLEEFMKKLFDVSSSSSSSSPISLFAGMLEWSGYYGAPRILKWFCEKSTSQQQNVLFLSHQQQSLHYALCRALERQTIKDVAESINMLKSRVVPTFSPTDAITVKSSVALQTALREEIISENLDLRQVFLWFDKAIEVVELHPNLLASLCLFTPFHQNDDEVQNIRKLLLPWTDRSSSSSSSLSDFRRAIAIRVAVPENVEIWNSTTKCNETFNFLDELLRRSLGMYTYFAGEESNVDISATWTKEMIEDFFTTLLDRFGHKIMININNNCRIIQQIQTLNLNLLASNSSYPIVNDQFVANKIYKSNFRPTTLNLSNCVGLTNEVLQTLASDVASDLRSLHLSNCKNINDMNLLNELLIARRGTGLCHVNLSGLDPNIQESYCDVAEKIINNNNSSLSSIDLSSHPACEVSVVVPLLVTLAQQFQELNLSNSTRLLERDIIEFCNLLPSSVTSISLSNTTAVTDAALAALSNNNNSTFAPTLKILNLSKCSNITFAAFRSTATAPPSFPSLTELDFSYTAIDDEAVGAVCQRMSPHLQTVNLEHCLGITDSSVRHCAQFLCSTLTSLNISRNSDGISDTGIQFLIENAKNLTHLDLSELSNISSDAFEDIVASLGGTIKTLIFVGCDQLGMDHAVRLREKLPGCKVKISENEEE